jgi:predicted phage gp36 major capsid-like protein
VAAPMILTGDYPSVDDFNNWFANVVNSSGIPTGQRRLIARKRTGGNVTDLNAFRFLLM